MSRYPDVRLEPGGPTIADQVGAALGRGPYPGLAADHLRPDGLATDVPALGRSPHQPTTRSGP